MKPQSSSLRRRPKDDEYPMTPESIARAKAAAQAERDDCYLETDVYIDEKGIARWDRSKRDISHD